MSLLSNILYKTPNYANEAKKAERKRQEAIKTGTSDINSAFSGFDPSFYQQRAQAYQNYALPQLSQQYQQNRDQVGYNLANRGLLQSGAAGKQWSDLARTNAQAQQGIADSGIAQAQALQRQVEDARNQQLGFLNQSADPAAARQGAIATAASFQQPSVFAPIANEFQGLAQQYYLSQLINQNRPTSYVQSPTDTYNNSGALGPSSYSVGGGQ